MKLSFSFLMFISVCSGSLLLKAQPYFLQESGYSLLALPIALGDVEAVQDLVSSGADVDRPDQNGMTPLRIASCRGDLELVEKLLEAGADVHCQGAACSWASPVLMAIGFGYVDIVSLLLQNGALTSLDELKAALACARYQNQPEEMVKTIRREYKEFQRQYKESCRLTEELYFLTPTY
ncbi:MAG: ankyrin repeat domain-containing protein [Deltaproteobacteria bacterium]|nr:ankyrin repeat domain-containing protein [Deltaproteobacteria bacterium]